MRWPRVVRTLVALVGLGTAGALYMMTRERVAEEPIPVSSTVDTEASVQSGQTTQIRHRGSDREFTITAESTRLYEDGRNAWIAAVMQMDDGTRLSADVVETRGQSNRGSAMAGELILKGNVRMQTSEGAVVEADEGTYTDDNGIAVMPGAVKFTRGRLSGTGHGGTYERDTGVFKLLANAHVTSAANEQGGQVDATAQTMTFNRANKALLFDGRAKIAQQTQEMTADRATLFLADDNEQFRVIELRGGSRVAPVTGQQSDVPEMQAQDIDLSFHPGTQALERAILNRQASMVLVEGASRRAISASAITLATAPDGKTITHLDATERVVVRTPAQKGIPARTITSSTLVATGDGEKGLTAALFDGGVTFVETVPAGGGQAARTRTGTSQRMTLKLRGQLDAVDEAQFQQNVKFKDGEVEGDADLGTYREAQGQLTLQPARGGKRAPRVVTGSVTVDALELIDVELASQDLFARGDVKTVSSGKATAPRDEGALFNGREPMYGFSTEFRYGGKVKQARYVGRPGTPATIKQGENVVTADEIVLVDETRDLTAKGHVNSTMELTSRPAAEGGTGRGAAGASPTSVNPGAKAGAPVPTKYQVQADSLDYKDAARTATYVGKPVTLTGPDGVTTAQRMVMTLAAESRELEQLDAGGEVRATLGDGREALADDLHYESALDRYTLRGRPFVLRVMGEKPGTCTIWKGQLVYFTAGAGAPETPLDENRGGVERIDGAGVVCTGALQK